MMQSSPIKMHFEPRKIGRLDLVPVEPEPPLAGPCDGYTAGRILSAVPLSEFDDAVELICERVARYGGRP